MSNEISDKKIIEALEKIDQGQTPLDIAQGSPELKTELELIAGLQKISAKINVPEEALHKVLAAIPDPEIKVDKKPKFNLNVIFNKKVFAGALAMILLMAITGVIFVLPKMEKQEATKKFVSNIEQYTFTDLDKFDAESEEIKNFLDDDDFMGLYEDLLAMAEIDLGEFADEPENETNEPEKGSFEEIEKLADEIEAELNGFLQDNTDLLNIEQNNELEGLEDSLKALDQV